jgi:hypothetical protein
MVTRALDAAVAAAPPLPRARLEAFVTASFTAPIAQPALLATWIAFWSLVTSQPQIARQHDEQYAGYRARLESLLREAGVAEADLRHAAIAVTALVDGLWLELCLSPQCFSSEEAGAIARRFLGTVCGVWPDGRISGESCVTPDLIRVWLLCGIKRCLHQFQPPPLKRRGLLFRFYFDRSVKRLVK